MSIRIEDLEDMSEYRVGIWKSPYVKVISTGGRQRIVEISNYRRVYWRETPRYSDVYDDPLPFTVTEDDLNWWVDGEPVYRVGGEIFRIGEEATRYSNEIISETLPNWVESDDLPFTPNLSEHEFLIDGVPGHNNRVSEGMIKKGSKFVKLKEEELIAIAEQMSSNKITIARVQGDSDKQILRIKYSRGRKKGR